MHDLERRAASLRIGTDAATAQVTVTADQDLVRAAEATAVLIKRRRTVLAERCRYIIKYYEVANDWIAAADAFLLGRRPTSSLRGVLVPGH